MKAPIFIISLPRSGSTMLQRLLATSSSISTHAEPWILLPHLYALKDEGQLTDYAYFNYTTAREDFISQLPNTRADYIKSLKEFGLSLYSKSCNNNEIYYLDKTPRYYQIIDELHEVFPDAKFIYLYRHPLAVFGSIITTFCQNKLLKLFNFFTDVEEGVEKVLLGYEKHKEASLLVYYEDLVAKPNSELLRIASFLDLMEEDFDISELSSIKFEGRFGDPTGVKKYDKVVVDSIDKWKGTFSNVFRFWLAKNYYKRIRNNAIKMGYTDLVVNDSLKLKLGNPLKIFEDIIYYTLAIIIARSKPNIHFGKIKHWASRKFLS